jgi:two-component system cell cycle sensor histidine kinase/response regulator CckA
LVRDISERKKLHEEMVKSEKLESLGLLAGGLAHDFNNYLAAIFGNIDLAKLSLKPDQEAYSRLVDAARASQRAADLTRQLLTFSKGGAPIKRLSSLTDVIRESVNFTLSGSNVRATFLFPKDSAPVDLDAGQMSQVFNNLVINARQAMPNGGTIVVTVRNIMLDADTLPPLSARPYVQVSFADTGVGIPEAFLTKIFDPYFTTKQQGSGLGLSSVYSIMRKHDGHITVESVLGAGTTFHLFLPASPASRETPPLAAAPLATGRGRVLVMDDEQPVREVVVHMLEKLGYEQATARDGREAVEMYKSALDSGQRFDGVIMDLTIPGGMGGAEAMRLLLALDPQVKAIVSSGYSNNSILADYRAHGFAGVITKPFSLETLSGVLKTVLHNKER